MSVDFFEPLVPTALAALIHPVVASGVNRVAWYVRSGRRGVTVRITGHRLSVRVGADVSQEDLDDKILEGLGEKPSRPR